MLLSKLLPHKSFVVRKLSAVIAETSEKLALTAVLRADGGGSRRSSRLREGGWIPGILYGQPLTTPQPVQVEAKELRGQLRIAGSSFENQIMELTVGDVVHRVLPRELQTHPG
jgi:ribosomal protein L25 (general stress protein Ctc)